MNSTAKNKSYSAIEATSRIPNHTSGVPVAPRRGMHEIKRSILKKLWLRMNREDCCCS